MGTMGITVGSTVCRNIDEAQAHMLIAARRARYFRGQPVALRHDVPGARAGMTGVVTEVNLGTVPPAYRVDMMEGAAVFYALETALAPAGPEAG